MTEITALDNVVITPDIEQFVYAREHYGTQAQTADALGLFQQNISDYEKGVNGIDARTYSLFMLISGYHPNYSLVATAERDLLVPVPKGQVIRKYRNDAKITQAQMAYFLRLSAKGLISRYENNKQSPSIQCWSLFLLIINKHPSYMLQSKKL